MSDSILDRIPVVAGLAYIERVRRLPSAFNATLQVEPGHPYFRHAVAVVAGGEKVGYVAPEIAGRYYEAIKDAQTVTCPGRRASHADHEASGVELLLDFSSVPVPSDEKIG